MSIKEGQIVISKQTKQGQITISTQKKQGQITVSTQKKEGFISGGTYSNNYTSLTNKPSINGIILAGDLTTADLGIIDDETVSDLKTYSSKKIQQLVNSFVIKEVIGTEENPIIISELDLGSYVISGIVQSSVNNPITVEVPRKEYVLNRDIEGTTVLWDNNPYTASQFYIALFDEKGKEPVSKTIELVTKDDLESASLDGGEF